ncbi:Acid sugar phosphatase (plasmid) [Sulfitobacter indolifex]|uniref:Haloacid dehalogenase-like hydrolase n=1 Tax=Sulfitobacter indolifex HEL-45 TaxID=391624 RepID=A0ABP2D460_9RHOB|nr:HAD hydrolase-like protein [Sulfitobacter indolifex]EDQ03047.1 Haloacid dehalogenase-like hydrolase [Sulfitobacter indolifex HEL-45]UOA21032.1 Acid sugar phosphatase [Sulfitobacter indolifex]
MSVGIDPAQALAEYQRLRPRLPTCDKHGAGEEAARFLDIIAPYDLILFDAYGVLNVGETAIDCAAETIAALRAMGKAVSVVSNSAAYPKAHMMERYARLGFDFTHDEVFTSRDALLDRVAEEPRRHWGVMLNPVKDMAEFAALGATVLADNPKVYEQVEGFLLVGADGWTDARQLLLETSLARHPRPVFVGNPDLVAPREDGLSLEPGWFAHRLIDATGVPVHFCGKPFPDIFELALARRSTIDPARVLMVGDTLHTDILGGAQAGFATALVTGHGSLLGLDVGAAIRGSGITPDHIVREI